MATYKVIQDIEAEDKFLGPLTLKQFVFGAASAIFIYLSVIAVSKNAAWMLVVFMPPALLGAFLAIPWSKDQPTEVWVLAKLRFYFKPKVRIWDQSGVKEVVTVTVPKKIERQLTDNLSQTEVNSRLKALAETIDSRGWAIKHSGLASAAVDMNFNSLSDRLISPATLPKAVPEYDISHIDDVMDPAANPIAASLDQMILSSNEARRGESLQKMNRARHGEPLDSVDQPDIPFTPPAFSSPSLSVTLPTLAPPPTVQPVTAPIDEQQLSEKLRTLSHKGEEAYGRLHTVPISGPARTPEPTADSAGTHEVKNASSQSSSTMTTPSSPVILDLAQNDDLSVETIARQAKKSQELSDNSEVIISLR